MHTCQKCHARAIDLAFTLCGLCELAMFANREAIVTSTPVVDNATIALWDEDAAFAKDVERRNRETHAIALTEMEWDYVCEMLATRRLALKRNEPYVNEERDFNINIRRKIQQASGI